MNKLVVFAAGVASGIAGTGVSLLALNKASQPVTEPMAITTENFSPSIRTFLTREDLFKHVSAVLDASLKEGELTEEQHKRGSFFLELIKGGCRPNLELQGSQFKDISVLVASRVTEIAKDSHRGNLSDIIETATFVNGCDASSSRQSDDREP